jgi:hypothetical protein
MRFSTTNTPHTVYSMTASVSAAADSGTTKMGSHSSARMVSGRSTAAEKRS